MMWNIGGPVATVALILALGYAVPTGCSNGKLKRTAAEALAARDDAVRDLGTCQANTRSLDAAIAAQNAAIDRQQAEGEAKVRAATAALAEASKGRAAAQARAAGLMRPPVGIDACARMASADEAVLQALGR